MTTSNDRPCRACFLAALAVLLACLAACDGSRSPLAGDPGDASAGSPDASSDARPRLDAATACTPDDDADCAKKCGEVTGRCGNVLSCGGCAVGQACGGGGAPNVCGVGTCTPSCTGKTCGESDGCSGTCTSGSCGEGQRCVGGACHCDTTSCSGCCAGDVCQPGTDGAACGTGGVACSACSGGQACGTGDCGTCGGNGQPCCTAGACGSPLTCGGGGKNGVCGCTPDCTGKACGADDGCAGACATGSCAGGQHCIAGACTCDPTSCTGCCSGTTCEPGTSGDACGGGGTTCVSCSAGQSCGTSCGACGGKGQACCAGGQCASPLTCGGDGTSGTCGCTPSCAGKACGADDGCGGICETGSCGGGLHCVGGACACDASSCAGCCSSGACAPGTATSACGAGGDACLACTTGQACTAGACGCAADQALCGGACTDIQSDSNNCGGCGRLCSSGDSCYGGTCHSTCPAGQQYCDPNGCTDVGSDPQNCGGCGSACATYQACIAGVCTCELGSESCSGACTSTDDPGDCGSCKGACAQGQSCIAAACTSSCPPSQTACGAVCVDTSDDPANCGGCGRICASAGALCSKGSCQSPTIYDGGLGIYGVCPGYLAADATNIYVLSDCYFAPNGPTGKILSLPIASPSAQPTVLAIASGHEWFEAQMLVDANNVYWTVHDNQAGGSTIMQAPIKPGASIQLALVPSALQGNSIGIDSAFVYFVSGQTVQRVPIGGGAQPANVFAAPEPIEAITVSGATLYTLTSGHLLAVPTGGGTATTLATGNETGFEASGTRRMWVSSGTVYFGNDLSIVGVPATGGAPRVLAPWTNPYDQDGLALAGNSTRVYWNDDSWNILSVPVAGGTPTVEVPAPTSPSAGRVQAVATNGGMLFWAMNLGTDGNSEGAAMIESLAQ